MDFHHPNNYFVLTENIYNDSEEFLILPNVKIDQAKIDKYSFTN